MLRASGGEGWAGAGAGAPSMRRGALTTRGTICVEYRGHPGGEAERGTQARLTTEWEAMVMRRHTVSSLKWNVTYASPCSSSKQMHPKVMIFTEEWNRQKTGGTSMGPGRRKSIYFTCNIHPTNHLFI